MSDLDNLEVTKITITKSKNLLRAQERERKQRWYGQVMEKLQYLSVAIRPQTIRAMWVKDVVNKKKT
jgi:hypothetical protein